MLTLTKKTLLFLFFAGLFGLWWADYARVPTSRAAAVAKAFVVPELFDVRPGDVRRVEIETEKVRVVLERKGDQWEMASPTRALASSAKVDALLTTLKTLRKSGDAGSISGDPAEFGLKPPASTIRVFGSEEKTPIAALELGKLNQDQRYVRDTGGTGIDLVDKRLLSPIESPAADWRQRSVLPFSSIDVTSVAIEAGGRQFRADREGGRWEIVKPARAPGDEQKLEGLVADLVALEVADGAEGFVSGGSRDFAKYGLDKPAMTIEVRGGKPPRVHSVAIGSPVSGVEGRVYARRNDDDETVILPSKLIASLALAPIAWRSKRVSNFDPNRVTRIQVKQGGVEHDLVLGAEGWQVVRPAAGRADLAAVQQFLGRLSIAQGIEVREPTADLKRFLDPPEAEIVLSQASTDASGSKPAEAVALDLKVGRLDKRREIVNVQLAGDSTILGLAIKPLSVLDLLPNGPLGFRDRTIFGIAESRIDQITIRHDGKTVDLIAGDNPIDLPSWRMIRPITSTIDNESLGRLTLLLARMRADRLVADAPGDLKPFGLDSPAETITWKIRPDTTGKSKAEPGPTIHSLKIGAAAAESSRPGARFAQVSGVPTVFTLSREALAILNAELRDHRILNFRTSRVQSLTLKWPGSTRTFRRKPRAFAGPDDWESDPTESGPGIDSEKLNTLLTMMANLTTGRFSQYEGPFPAESGLSTPSLTVDVDSGGGVTAPVSLRIGAPIANQRFATVESGPSGAAFLLPSGSWEAYIAAGKPKSELPANVFAH